MFTNSADERKRLLSIFIPYLFQFQCLSIPILNIYEMDNIQSLMLCTPPLQMLCVSYFEAVSSFLKKMNTFFFFYHY